MALPLSERSGLGTMSSGSICNLVPRPWHSSHAPCGELNEKVRGSISGRRRAVVGAGELLAEDAIDRLFVGDVVDDDHAVAQPQRRFNRVGQAAALQIGLDDQAIDHRFDGVVLVAIEFDRVVDVVQFAVDAHAHVAGLADVLEDLLVMALAILDQRREDLNAAAFGHGRDRVDDLIGGLLLHLAAADRAVRRADAGVEQAQVVVDFRRRAHGRSGVAAGPALIDRDGGTQPFDLIDVGLLHLAEELPRVSAERFDVAALPFGEDRVEGQRRFAAAAEAGDDDHFVARNVHADVLQVVSARPAHGNVVLSHGRLLMVSGLVVGCRLSADRAQLASPRKKIITRDDEEEAIF